MINKKIQQTEDKLRDKRKRNFVALRLDNQLMLDIVKISLNTQKDVSTVIRELCKDSLSRKR